MVWGILNEKEAPIGPVAKLQAHVERAARAERASERREGQDRRDARFRGQDPQPHRRAVRRPKVEGLPGQSQPLHNWRLREYAANHRKSDPAVLRNARRSRAHAGGHSEIPGVTPGRHAALAHRDVA